MRVLFLTDSLSDLDGVGRYAVRLIGALEALRPGFEVRVLLSRKHRPTSDAVPAHWDVSVGLPPDYFYYMPPLRFAASLWTGTRNATRAARGVDLIHAIKDYPHNLVGLRAADGHSAIPVAAQLCAQALQTGGGQPSLGRLTAAIDSPTLQQPLALALLQNGHQRMDETLWAVSPLEQQSTEVVVTAPCFVDPDGSRVHG